jgi:transposase
MTNYREILRLKSLGISNSQIAESMMISRQTVVSTLQRAAAQCIDWSSAESLNDRDLTSKLFPNGNDTPSYKMPDYDYVHKEMAKPGVTQQLLWLEYCNECRDSGKIPYQLTQFKKYYREYLVTTKATMHIKRKPGEMMEVDWAGQTAQIVDRDTEEIMDAYIFVSALAYSGYSYFAAQTVHFRRRRVSNTTDIFTSASPGCIPETSNSSNNIPQRL